MRTFKEARGDTAVFTFGRFNPPTTGHEKLIDALAREQGKNPGSIMYVYPSHSQNAKKDPLPHAKKVAYMKKMFSKYKKNIRVSRARNIFEVAVELHNKGHKAVVMVVGSDRVDEFDDLLNKYNGEEGKHGFYGFDDIKVISAGERDPDAEGVEGMSASKMRAAASQNDYESFKQGLPKGFTDGEKLFKDVRKNMGIREGNTFTTEEIHRDLYVRGEIWNVGDVVKTTDGDEGTIIRRGANYVVFEDLRRVWLHNLEEVKQDKDIKDREGTQPAKYYAKDAEGDDMKKSTKKSRARHFDKGAKMDDDNPAAYKPAPGDKGAKTKPSKYTKKFKQMYGEAKGDLNDLKAMVKELQGAVKIHKGQSERVAAHVAMMDKAGAEGPKGQGGKKDLQTIVKELEKASKSHERQSISVQKHIDFMVSMEEVILERKLTDGEKNKLKKYEKEIDMKDFIDRYGEEEGKAIYYATLTKMAKKEGLWDNIRKKKERIARGSGERMRKPGEKGAPTPDQIKRAKGEQTLNCGCGKEPCETYGKLDERSILRDIRDKIYNMTHPKEMDRLIKAYVNAVTSDTRKRHGGSFHAGEVIRRVGGVTTGVDVRQFMDYINDLVRKGVLPRELMAQNVTEEMKPEDSLKNWKHDDAKGYAEKLIKEYGQPDEVTETMLKWNKLGSFGKGEMETYIVDESIPHDFPKPHRDYVYTVMNIKVPSDMLDTLGHVTGSIIYDGLKETITARCGSLYANAATMGFVRDMVDGKVPVEDGPAKKEYAERITKDPLPKFYDNRMNEDISHMCCGRVELEEKYDLYHKTFSGAMQHAYSYAKKKLGVTIDPKEIDNQVATGPRKPSEGKTNKYRLKGKGGNIQIQVYNKGGSKPFELNMYKEDVQLDEKIEGLVKKSEKSGVPYGILKKVYNRGMAAWRTGHRPGTTPQQWAFARVNSFLTGGGARKSDADLWSKASAAKKKKESYEIGQDYANHTYEIDPYSAPKKKATKESIQEWYENEEVHDKYRERYGERWVVKLTETYDKMMEKVPCCEECEDLFDHVIMEAEYQGKKVKLNDPIRTSENPNKKFKVYVKNEKGKVVVVRFGDPNMAINRDDPERRKSFRARHNCDDPGPKTKARYWSCFQWRAGAKVDN
mgnify:CR=1 FL=1